MSVRYLLLIEDDMVSLPKIQEKLALSKLEVTSLYLAKNLVDAISVLKGNVIDVILLALDLDNDKSVYHLRAIRSYTDSPIIVLSNNENELLAIDALREGANEFLVKSRTSPEELRRVILCVVNRHEIRKTTKKMDEKLSLLCNLNAASGC